MTHQFYMKQALDLAKQARYLSPPNPWVGCIIVNNGQIVGKGHTQTYGQAHAETIALLQAKEKAKGGIMYVTLEPCSHYGFTPPCVDTVIRSGISEIYIAQEDPDQRVSGKGIAKLKEAGIKVHLGLCQEDAKMDLLSYLHHRKTNLPYTIIKSGITLDGRIAAKDNTSQWITSDEARDDAHNLRADSQAILIGSGTAISDQPRLTVRKSNLTLFKQPLRILLDSRGRVPVDGPLFDQHLAPTIIFTTNNVSIETQKAWERKGIESIIVPTKNEKIDLHEVLKILGKRGVLQLLVEGGSKLQSQFLEQRLANRLIIYIGSLLLGSSGIPFFNKDITTLSEAYPLKFDEVKTFGNSVRISYSI